MRGQVTLINMLMVIIVFIVTVVLIPPLSEVIEATVTVLEADPNSMTSTIVLILRLIPFVLILVVILGALRFANPKVEQASSEGGSAF